MNKVFQCAACGAIYINKTTLANRYKCRCGAFADYIGDYEQKETIMTSGFIVYECERCEIPFTIPETQISRFHSKFMPVCPICGLREFVKRKYQ